MTDNYPDIGTRKSLLWIRYDFTNTSQRTSVTLDNSLVDENV